MKKFLDIVILVFPGSNCDDDCYYAVAQTAQTIQNVRVHNVWHEELSSYVQTHADSLKLIIIPGGFSYGDYLRPGALAAFSDAMEVVRVFENKGGFVLGICNGFQILCEAKILPGVLVKNKNIHFICKDVEISLRRTIFPWVSDTLPRRLSFPIAHADGCYILGEGRERKEDIEHQILCTYEENPNGSFMDIAGILNKKGNVLGLMPHPERAFHLGSGDGALFFQTLVGALSHGNV